MRMLKNLFITGIVFAILFEIVSALYFTLGLSRIAHFPVYWSDAKPAYDQYSEPTWRTEHEDWGSWHLPNGKTRMKYACFDFEVEANSYGARDKERIMDGTTDRVVVLGDSFIEGWGVERQYRLTDRLEAKYNKEFLNFGAANNFGPLQYEILYRDLASKFSHDTLMIGLLPGNDFVDNDVAWWQKKGAGQMQRYRPYYDDNGNAMYMVSKPEGVHLFEEYLKPKTTVQWIKKVLGDYTWSYGVLVDIKRTLALKMHQMKKDAETGGVKVYRNPTETQLRNVMGSLERIIEIAGSEREIFIFILPAPGEHAALLRGDELIVPPIIKTLEKHQNVKVYDINQDMLDIDPDYNKFGLGCDGHWGPYGNEVAADVIAEYLELNE